jgi:hypothetical protein
MALECTVSLILFQSGRCHDRDGSGSALAGPGDGVLTAQEAHIPDGMVMQCLQVRAPLGCALLWTMARLRFTFTAAIAARPTPISELHRRVHGPMAYIEQATNCKCGTLQRDVDTWRQGRMLASLVASLARRQRRSCAGMRKLPVVCSPDARCKTGCRALERSVRGAPDACSVTQHAHGHCRSGSSSRNTLSTCLQNLSAYCMELLRLHRRQIIGLWLSVTEN